MGNKVSNCFDIITIAYDISGIILWSRIYNGPLNENDYAWDLVLDSNGHCYVTGMVNNRPNQDYVTLKYDSAGNLLWTDIVDGPFKGNDEGEALFVNNLDILYTAGLTETGRKYDIMISKYWP